MQRSAKCFFQRGANCGLPSPVWVVRLLPSPCGRAVLWVVLYWCWFSLWHGVAFSSLLLGGVAVQISFWVVMFPPSSFGTVPFSPHPSSGGAAFPPSSFGVVLSHPLLLLLPLSPFGCAVLGVVLHSSAFCVVLLTSSFSCAVVGVCPFTFLGWWFVFGCSFDLFDFIIWVFVFFLFCVYPFCSSVLLPALKNVSQTSAAKSMFAALYFIPIPLGWRVAHATCRRSLLTTAISRD